MLEDPLRSGLGPALGHRVYCSDDTTRGSPPLSPVVAGEQATPLGQVTVKTVTNAKLGKILTDAKRMTLYRYTQDTPNVSNCYDQCAQNWPPLLVTTRKVYLGGGIAGKLGTITRTDGGEQITYDGTPLYYSANDAKPGDTTGQGVGDFWYAVQPISPQSAFGAVGY